MQDEHFIRQWNRGHNDFTADLHSTLNLLGRYQRSRSADVRVIGSPYDRVLDKTPASELSPAAKSSLRGIAASVITLGLWVVVMALATPAPGLATSVEAPVAAAPDTIELA